MNHYRHTSLVSTKMRYSVLSRGIEAATAIAVVVAGLLLGTPTHAQQKNPPIFESVTLSPRFSPDPLTLKGISGGSISAAQLAGRQETVTGPCIGFIDEAPNHTLELTTFFDYLRLQVQSPDDTTLVVKGPGGSWCNDDYEGKNPGIAGQWLPGKYQVWIGSYNRNQFHPYTLRLTEVQ